MSDSSSFRCTPRNDTSLAFPPDQSSTSIIALDLHAYSRPVDPHEPRQRKSSSALVGRILDDAKTFTRPPATFQRIEQFAVLGTHKQATGKNEEGGRGGPCEASRADIACGIALVLCRKWRQKTMQRSRRVKDAVIHSTANSDPKTRHHPRSALSFRGSNIKSKDSVLERLDPEFDLNRFAGSRSGTDFLPRKGV
ncbi:hypothetical protein BC826DRAFT_1169512 [Russula brevipes]|nr:hypothetical protein BC826DRAFT_1169512 [Russula brevipes]